MGDPKFNFIVIFKSNFTFQHQTHPVWIHYKTLHFLHQTHLIELYIDYIDFEILIMANLYEKFYIAQQSHSYNLMIMKLNQNYIFFFLFLPKYIDNFKKSQSFQKST